MTLDLDFIRAQFPAFQTPDMQGQVFCENAGGSFACRQVIDRLTRFYTERKVQPYSSYRPSALGGDEMDEARDRLSAVLGVTGDELSFGPSTTQNVYVLAQAFREFLSPGDAIVVSNQDHEANAGAWRRLADHGIEVREWELTPETGLLDLETLDAVLDEKVKLICFPHCSNVVGAVNPVKEVVARAKSIGAYTCVDGVSYAPHGLPNVADLGADIYMFSAYKTYGPHQGIMVVRKALAEQLPNQAHGFNADSLYKKFTPAGPDHAQVAACAGMVDYLEAVFDHHFKGDASLTQKAERVHDLCQSAEQAVVQPLLDYLKSKNSVRMLGPDQAAQRAPTVALHLQRTGLEVAGELVKFGIQAGGGDFYAVRPLRALGIDPDHGVLRLSFVHYTSAADIDQLINALDQTL